MRTVRLVAFVVLLGVLSGCLHQRQVADGIPYPAVRKVHSWRATYKPLAGALFATDGPSPYDVEQGQVGTCWLLAAMAATARQQPQRIRDMFQTDKPGVLRVTFENARQWPSRNGRTARTPPDRGDHTTVTIDSEVPHGLLGGPIYARSRHGTWVSLLEKAYAQKFAPREGYDGIGGDHPRTALARLTGWRVEDYDVDGNLSPPTEDEEWRYLLETYRRGAPMVAGSRIFQPRRDIVPMHAYAVTGMYEDEGGNRFVRLFDPEGLNSYPNHEFALLLDHFNDYFFYVSIAHPPASPPSPAATP